MFLNAFTVLARLARSTGLTCILQETGVNYRENIQNSIEFSLLNL